MFIFLTMNLKKTFLNDKKYFRCLDCPNENVFINENIFAYNVNP